MKPDFISENRKFKLYHADCFNVMRSIKQCSIDMIFSDPPYFLSGKGITCRSGKMASVNKGLWDKIKNIDDIHRFNFKWISMCQDLLTEDGTIWISGTHHNIYSIGMTLQQLGFKILNSIVWQKSAPPPNLSCRYFTHSYETVIWAAKSNKSKHFFDYKKMKSDNNNKQMKDIWTIGRPLKDEKNKGKHPTQKPEALLERIVRASTKRGDLVLDPFNGSGTTGMVCYDMDRKYIGIEKEKEYYELTKNRFLHRLGR